MARNVAEIREEIQRLEPSAIVDLFVLDLTIFSGPILRFHAGVNGLNNDIVWQGNTYTRYPLEASGFERNSNGTLPRPKIIVANLGGEISSLLQQFDDLVGAKLTRKRTFVKYLDAVNFPGSTNPTADPDAHFEDELWIVDRKATENQIFVEFELSAAFDLAGVMLPRRQCIKNMCTWKYRSPECGYTGNTYFNSVDEPVSTLAEDVCGKKLISCRLRFGDNAELPYGGFPGVGLLG